MYLDLGNCGAMASFLTVMQDYVNNRQIFRNHIENGHRSLHIPERSQHGGHVAQAIVASKHDLCAKLVLWAAGETSTGKMSKPYKS